MNYKGLKTNLIRIDEELALGSLIKSVKLGYKKI